jgi:hypothetical protein
MAKMFYTMDETKAALSKNEEEIKQLAREGRLREFRDGPRLMFKADQVEHLKAELGGGKDQVDLGPSDSGSPIGLVDSRTASGTGIALTDTDMGPSPGAGMTMKEDTALAADLGLVGSVGGTKIGPGGTGAGMTGSMAGRSASGINVFRGDEMQVADPSAATAISGGPVDQVSLEGMGSGSGLLDLTRESDDTSLGAELLDEITPGAGKRAPGGSTLGAAAGMAGRGAMTGAIIGTPVLMEAADSSATAFGAGALGAAFMLLFAAFALISAIIGIQPQAVKMLTASSPDGWGLNIWMIWLIGVIVAGIFWVAGYLVGKTGAK